MFNVLFCSINTGYLLKSISFSISSQTSNVCGNPWVLCMLKTLTRYKAKGGVLINTPLMSVCLSSLRQHYNVLHFYEICCVKMNTACAFRWTRTLELAFPSPLCFVLLTSHYDLQSKNDRRKSALIYHKQCVLLLLNWTDQRSEIFWFHAAVCFIVDWSTESRCFYVHCLACISNPIKRILFQSNGY